MLEAAEADLELADGEVRVAGVRQRRVGLGDLARVLCGGPGYAFPDGMEPGVEAAADFRTDALAYANACRVVAGEGGSDTRGGNTPRSPAIPHCTRPDHTALGAG